MLYLSTISVRAFALEGQLYASDARSPRRPVQTTACRGILNEKASAILLPTWRADGADSAVAALVSLRWRRSEVTSGGNKIAPEKRLTADITWRASVGAARRIAKRNRMLNEFRQMSLHTGKASSSAVGFVLNAQQYGV